MRSAGGLLGILLIAAIVPAHPALADSADFEAKMPSTPRFVDSGASLRAFDRARNELAMSGVKGDTHFNALLKRAVWLPPHKQIEDTISMGGPFATPELHALARREILRRPLPECEPLPPEMLPVLARRYLWYKECLAKAKEGNFLPNKVRTSSIVRGVFQLSAEATDLGGARRELVNIAGEKAVDQLELEIYPLLGDTESNRAGGWKDAPSVEPIDPFVPF